MIPLASPTDWMRSALCAQIGEDHWYPEGAGASARIAKAICRKCPVAAECLAYAIANDEMWGVWGATTERQRRDMLAKIHRRNRICAECGGPVTGARRSYCGDKCAELAHRALAIESERRRRRERGAA